jgi:hypothetical protein
MKVVTSAWCAEGKTVLNAQDGCFEQQTPREALDNKPTQRTRRRFLFGRNYLRTD